MYGRPPLIKACSYTDEPAFFFLKVLLEQHTICCSVYLWEICSNLYIAVRRFYWHSLPFFTGAPWRKWGSRGETQKDYNRRRGTKEKGNNRSKFHLYKIWLRSSADCNRSIAGVTEKWSKFLDCHLCTTMNFLHKRWGFLRNCQYYTGTNLYVKSIFGHEISAFSAPVHKLVILF